MPSAAALRIQIEHSLERRFPSALTPVPRSACETASTGIPQIDLLLDGGLPVGAISEITGPESSGRTSLALAFLAQRTREERVCAWVDAQDAFDAESAAASGAALTRLLWVRCRNQRPTNKPWSNLDQAIRSADLLLQAGGFAALVLDLGSTAPEHASRIPLATWFRFRQAAARTQCSLLVLAQASFAQSSAALVLECSPLQPESQADAVLTGFSSQVHRRRERFTPDPATRKPPASTWSLSASWDEGTAATLQSGQKRPGTVTEMEKRA